MKRPGPGSLKNEPEKSSSEVPSEASPLEISLPAATDVAIHPVWDKFEPRFEILPPAQQALWPNLREASKLGFVLYGGTAIALRLGHRESVDFDFFSEKPFSYQELVQAMPILEKAVVLQDEPKTLTLGLDMNIPGENQVKVSFFTVETGRVHNPEWTSDGVLLVASMKDLMAHKLKVVLQRLEKKDYLDVHALLASGYTLEDAIAGARAMYSRAFQPSEALKALTYFKGGDLDQIPAKVQKDLIQWVAMVENLPPVPDVTKSLGGGEL
jgi:hypothetical protein